MTVTGVEIAIPIDHLNLNPTLKISRKLVLSCVSDITDTQEIIENFKTVIFQELTPFELTLKNNRQEPLSTLFPRGCFDQCLHSQKAFIDDVPRKNDKICQA